ncbi:Gamma-tubulin complex component 3, partial [Gryllus bimaculatus]
MPPKRSNPTKKLLFDLVKRLTKSENDQAVISVYVRFAEQLKQYSERSTFECSETYLAEKIKKTLQLSESSHLVSRFEELHRRLQCGEFLKKREAVLFFLLCLGSSQKEQSRSSSTVSITNLSHNATLPQPITSSPQTNDPVSSTLPTLQVTPSALETWRPGGSEMSVSSALRSYVGNVLHTSSDKKSSKMHSTYTSTIASTVLPDPLKRVVLQDLIFSFQGIPGTLLKLDPVSLGFKLDPRFSVSRPIRRVVLRLAELGWLHNRLRRFCEEAESSRSLGLMEKSLVCALREELTEYYRLVAVLQAQALQQQQLLPSADSPLSEEPFHGSASSGGLTLRSLGVWALEPTERLRCLVAIAETSKNRKGGALASAVHSFLQSGDPVERRTARHLLAAVCKPLYLMLSRWVVDGELEDPYGEFFIAADPQVTGERLWYDKYRVQSDLVPSFVPMAEANKILATGKSINFLREVCQDQTPIHGRDMLRQALDAANVEALFTSDRDGDLGQVMEMAYQEVSRRVLDVLSGPHKFLENLHALRRYLLLGQGDFIRHLMEIINPELCKPASHLYGHNLSGILETAIRATNAQFEDPEILQRLDVRLLELNAGDIGWDVFTLDYHFSGPISTIFVPNASSYLMLFSTLWRAKRSEYVLTGSWKRQTTAMRMLRKLPELAPVLQRTHLLTAEMIHLVQQMQYYMLFEVLECSWHEMLGKLGQAESLDDILKAHMQFLDKTKAGALLDNESKRLAARLRVVHSLVLSLEKIETDLHNHALQELAARNAHENTIEARGDAGEFGTDTAEEQAYEKARADFKKKYVRDVLTKLTILATDYQEQVKNFLLELADHPNNNLQLLSFRLDFNDHYKRREPRLVAPYTYQHRRLSEMGHRVSLTGAASPALNWMTPSFKVNAVWVHLYCASMRNFKIIPSYYFCFLHLSQLPFFNVIYFNIFCIFNFLIKQNKTKHELLQVVRERRYKRALNSMNLQHSGFQVISTTFTAMK